MFVEIRGAMLIFNVLWLEGHLEPDCQFFFKCPLI
jgi:hypothetical protein